MEELPHVRMKSLDPSIPVWLEAVKHALCWGWRELAVVRCVVCIYSSALLVTPRAVFRPHVRVNVKLRGFFIVLYASGARG